MRIGIAKRIAFTLADRDLSDAMSLGDLQDFLGLHTGTAIGERLREARTYYGFDIRCEESGEGNRKAFRYWIPLAQREQIKARPDYIAWSQQRKAA